jgi:hypothetical protein
MSAVTFGYVSIQGLEEEGMEGAHMLCMADAPEAKEEAVALWAWLRMQWALGLSETWAKTSRNEVRGHSGLLHCQLPMIGPCRSSMPVVSHPLLHAT